ncbi:PAS domain S-box protein [Belnapia sp. T6]|uniref:histidine kinase n=1 Tax=Belnapia mucosa TaxID=2804532 RepID=A0ABS1V6P5_9PROT|nr:ATP-binding protein [Belnapia mucosa]MBL6457352.1 PAS domain S-box protein [Belnapia mucosa]
MRPADPSSPGPVLVLAPVGRDAREIERILTGMGLPAKTHADLAGLCEDVQPEGGASVAALVVAEEALARGSAGLIASLAHQPAWSDLPVLVLTAGRHRRGSAERRRLLEALGNVTLLERPLHEETLRSAVRASLRARDRQHETRRYLEALRLAAETLESRVEERTRELAAEAAERARAEAAHRALYRQTPIALHSLDAEGRLQSVSDRWLEFMGYDARSEVIGRHITEFMTEDAARLHRMVHWPRLLAEGAWDDVEYRMVKQSGEVADVLVSVRVERNMAGGFARTMAALVDITARRRAEAELAREMAERAAAQERLRQAQKMEALGQLAGGVAHDFNNASAAVLAGITLLERRHGAALAAEGIGALRLLAGLREGAERGVAVSRRLLAFARREALNATRLDPAELLGGLRDLLGGTLGLGVRMRIEAPTGLPAFEADQRQLETVLINLAINARDAMPGGGEVILDAAAETVAEDSAQHPAGLRPGRYVRLSVRDTGIGMDAATMARATEPFFTTKPKDRGTGLGLSMASSFATQSGGGLRLESEPGRGTTVILWLPQAEGLEPAAPLPAAEAERPRALVVEPVSLTRRYLVHCLQDLAWNAAEAAGTDEAQALLTRQGFDLLLVTDPLPSGPDGITLARTARRHHPGLPVVLVIGPEASARLVTQAVREGLRVLRKPVSPTELEATLISLRQRPARESQGEAAD